MPDKAVPGRVLFVTPVMPSFSGGGSAMRAAALVEALASTGSTVRVAVVPVFGHRDTQPEAEIAALCESCLCLPKPKQTRSKIVRRLTAPFQQKPDSLPGEQPDFLWIRQIEKTLGPARDDLLFVFRLATLTFLSPRRLSSTPLWLDLDEIDSAAAFREAKLAEARGDHEAGRHCSRSSQSYQRVEERFLKRARHLSVSSEIERNRLPASFREKSLILPNIVRERKPLSPREPDAGPARLLFVGSFGHPPNVDAISYFCREIFAAIVKQMERPVELTVAGADPLQRLLPFQSLENVRILGWVENLDPLYTQTDLVIVPLRAGAGTRIKIIEAFSYGRCVVSTPVGAEGLNVASGVELMLAQDPLEFARICVELLNSPARRESLAAKGYDYYRREHTLPVLRRKLEAAWNSPENESKLSEK
jgi:glycosyltransferase involved in cell wall biosynthesis